MPKLMNNRFMMNLSCLLGKKEVTPEKNPEMAAARMMTRKRSHPKTGMMNRSIHRQIWIRQ